MNKKIYLLAVVLIVVFAFVAIKYLPRTGTDSNIESSQATSTIQTPKLSDEESKLENDAWNTFQDYLNAAKNHNLNEVKNLSYQLSSTCQDPKQINKCYEIMDSAAYLGSLINKKTLYYVWYDSKQIILASKYRKTEENGAVGYQRSILYFIRTADGIKLLGFNPGDGVIIPITSTTSTSTALMRLPDLIKDTDKDGLPDSIENCASDVVQFCSHTDPNKRDTNNNGWWDGIEVLFKS